MLLQFEAERRLELVRFSLVLLLLADGEADISDRKIIRETVKEIYYFISKTHIQLLTCGRKIFLSKDLRDKLALK